MGNSTSKPTFYAGVDLGGTKIMTGVFDAELQLIGFTKITTKAHRGPEAVIHRIVRCIEDAVDDCDLAMDQIKAIGIGAPGGVDPESGRVIFAPNLDWKNVGLKAVLEERLKIPVAVENDCNICTLGVHEKEFECKPQHLLGIYIGTGIGGGLILGGKLYSGFNRTAGEVGHMVIDVNGPMCGCGNQGCFEAFASRTALFNRIRAAVKAGEKTVLTDLFGPELSDLRSRGLRKAIRRNDKLVESLVKEAATYAGIAVGNLINILNPEVVVLGGGIIEALDDEMMPIITKVAKDHVLSGTGKGVDITATQLADNAGIFGGGVLARRMLKEKR